MRPNMQPPTCLVVSSALSVTFVLFPSVPSVLKPFAWPCGTCISRQRYTAFRGCCSGGSSGPFLWSISVPTLFPRHSLGLSLKGPLACPPQLQRRRVTRLPRLPRGTRGASRGYFHLGPSECTVPQNAPITPLECAVPKTPHFKFIRMRSSIKNQGGRVCQGSA